MTASRSTVIQKGENALGVNAYGVPHERMEYMDTIRNYLETMFMNLPGTPEVYKAKNELRQMMEDKYEELIREGKSENEAVGTVISEFGNLDELAKDLGIDQVVSDKEIPDGRLFTMDEVRAYLTDSGKYALRIALGVFLCVFAAVPPIFMEAVGAIGGKGDVGGDIGAAFMFVCVAAAVGIFIYSNVTMGKWDFMKRERLVTDFATTEYVHQEYNSYKSVHAMILTIGIILIILSFVPAIVLDALFNGNAFFDDLSGALVIAIAAMGVFLIVWTSNISGSFARLVDAK